MTQSVRYRPRQWEKSKAVQILNNWRYSEDTRAAFNNDFHAYVIRMEWDNNPDLRAEFFNDYKKFVRYDTGIRQGWRDPGNGPPT